MVRFETSRCSRRSFVAFVGLSGWMGGAVSCFESEGSALVLELGGLSDGERRVMVRDHVPVEFRKRGAEIRATVLLCTHQGCRVHWKQERHRYECTCHGGVFDQDGHPKLGPPKRPLKRLPVRTEADRAIVEL
ncbi:MAG: ubiquinol-cytochrome c reductase iron-sulfur subunit [Myxococcota bacterium]